MENEDHPVVLERLECLEHQVQQVHLDQQDKEEHLVCLDYLVLR